MTMFSNLKTRYLLMPKCVIPNELLDAPVFFLAGPIRGGGGWQMRAAHKIWDKYPGSIVVDPTRWDEAPQDALSEKERKLIRDHMKNAIGERDDLLYPAQAPWESVHMELAAQTGTLFFWFERQSTDCPRPKKEGVYAQDTRVEAGIWIERLKHVPKYKVKFGGHWALDKHGRETDSSFGGLNFIFFYLTGEKDRARIFMGNVKHPNLILADWVEEFIDKS